MGKNLSSGATLTEQDRVRWRRIQEHVDGITLSTVVRIGMSTIEARISAGEAVQEDYSPIVPNQRRVWSQQELEALPSTREEALAARSTHYNKGGCKHGHLAPTLTIRNMCTECARLLRLAWKEKNPDYHTQYKTKKYWEDPERITGIRDRQFWQDYEGPKKEIKALDGAIAIAEQAAKQ